MAITILSSNLNLRGDQGRFETDRSTWGFIDPVVVFDIDVRYTRQISEVYQGVYGAQIKCHSINADPAYSAGAQNHLDASWNIVAGKYYIISAYVKNDSSNPLYPDAADVYIGLQIDTGLGGAYTLQSEVKTTGLAAQAGWIKIEAKIKVDAVPLNPSPKMNAYITVDHPTAGETSIQANGIAYVDQFEIYEYEEIPASCDLAIDLDNCVVVHESGAAANGSITVATTGSVGTLEYSLDDVTYQLSNVFSGLSEGLKSVYVREQADPVNCKVQESFYINDDDTASFDFTLTTTDESVSGAENGQIEVSVTGSGAPFTYSINNGTSYQASNIFQDLAAGLYTIIVKDASNNLRAKNAYVSAGQFTFEKIFHSRNPINFTRNQSANSVEDNYRIQTEVQVESSLGAGDFTKLIATEVEPNSAGKCLFNLRQAFHGYFNPTPPSEDDTTLAVLTDRSILARNIYGDLYNLLTEISPASEVQGLPYLVVFGGIEAISFPDTDFFGQYLATNKKFLSWLPTSRIMDAEQENYVNFFIYSASITQVKMILTAYFDDDTSTASEIAAKNAIYGQIVQIPIGPANSGALAVNPAKNLLYYTIHLTNQADATISETLTITLSAFRPSTTRYLMYLNSLGSFEVIRTIGIGEEKAKVERQNAEKYLPSDYSALDGQLINYSSISQRSFSLSTGFVSKAMMKALQDFMLSSQVYDITDGQRKPIILQESSFTIHEDQNHQKALRFDYLDAYKNEVYSNV